MATTHGWNIRQLDVKNAFLHGYLNEPMYMEQPPGFQDDKHPTHICRLKRALYGLKQAPQAWFERISNFLFTLGFHCSIADPSLFICHSSQGTLLLLIYVDDMILTGNNTHFTNWFVQELGKEFAVKDLGTLHYFLGIEVQYYPSGLFLSQSKYARDILHRAQMDGCKPITTPMAIKGRTSSFATTEPFPDPKHYRSLVGALQYLTFTRPDLCYAVNIVCQFMHAPTMENYQTVKRILRYVSGTIDYGMHIYSQGSLDLYAFSDADWAGCPLTRRSTTGFCTFLGSTCISWCAKQQPTVARSSAKAEYRSMASTTAELTWLSSLLQDIRVQLTKPPILFCDNMSALYMTKNPVFHGQTNTSNLITTLFERRSL